MCIDRAVCTVSRNRGQQHTTVFFFFNDTATTEIYTLSLHDALPICAWSSGDCRCTCSMRASLLPRMNSTTRTRRSEEHTSELQSRPHLVCRLLLEKKKHLHYTCYEKWTAVLRLCLNTSVIEDNYHDV